MTRRLVSEALANGPRFLLDWKEARYFRRYGEIELGLVRDLCMPDRDAIDAGANEGMYVLFMRRHARHVLAFEPVTALHDKLRQRYDSRVTVRNVALSDRAGTAVLHVPLANGEAVTGLSSLTRAAAEAHPQHLDVRVPTARLDAIYDGEVGFIKIDVEGHEEALLDGAAATIERCHPRLLIETDESLAPGGLHRIIERLGGLGYAGFFVRGRTLEQAEAFDPQIYQRQENLDGYCPGRPRRDFDFVNNFIFMPRAEAGALRPRLEAALAQA